eukprot:gene22-80_t
MSKFARQLMQVSQICILLWGVGMGVAWTFFLEDANAFFWPFPIGRAATFWSFHWGMLATVGNVFFLTQATYVPLQERLVYLAWICGLYIIHGLYMIHFMPVGRCEGAWWQLIGCCAAEVAMTKACLLIDNGGNVMKSIRAGSRCLLSKNLALESIPDRKVAFTHVCQAL